MPTYVYRFVDTGETIEVQQAFSDAALTEATHPGTGQVMAVKKVFTPVGVTFKGSGFYKTDSRGSSSRTASATSTDGAGSSSSGSSSTSSSSGGDSSGSTGSKESSSTSSTSTSTSTTA